MKIVWGKKVYKGLLLLGLIGASVGVVGCADEYGAYPHYRGGYYASYSTGYPHYGGYGYGYPYRAGGPYYGGPYYGYGGPYYGGASVVVSGSRSYTYRDRLGRLHTTRRHANANRVRNTTSTTTRSPRTRATRVPAYQSDDESRYYPRPQ